MRLVTINSSTIHEYTADPEMLQKADRPCALIVKLKYKGNRHSFAIPLRSNISGSAPKDSYFPLPPRSTTKDGNRHGVHYIKMFPVTDKSVYRFRVENNLYANVIKNALDKNEKKIIAECQAYLDKYENGERYQYATDIDLLIGIMKGDSADAPKEEASPSQK